MVTGAERYFAEREAASSEYRDALTQAHSRIATVDGVMRALDDRRVTLGLSKAELARQAGMRPEVVRRLLGAGPANPTLSTVVALAEALMLEVEITTSAGVTGERSVAAGTHRRTA